MTEEEWQSANRLVQDLVDLKHDRRLYRQAVRSAARKVN